MFTNAVVAMHVGKNNKLPRTTTCIGQISLNPYSLRSEILVGEMNVPRCILVLDTSILATSISERREDMP